MRKLLVKLVAVETALLGWLSYWLFLVYADNPAVSQGLANELNRFPQISYTTIDISTIVIITIFSILVAIKFDRGLRPGMKLERALQMLESLMKRNLFLESQLAEYRIDKPSAITGTGSILSTQPINPNLPSQSSSSLGLGSWEKAFRTPIEAGPSIPKSIIPPPSPNPTSASPSSGPGSSPKPTGGDLNPKDDRISITQSSMADRPKPTTTASNWEDNPRRTMENTGIISTTQPPPRRPLVSVPPQGASQSNRPPYIPVPAARAPPLSVITGITSQVANQGLSSKAGVAAQARPIAHRPVASTNAGPTGITDRGSQTQPPSPNTVASIAKPITTSITTKTTVPAVTKSPGQETKKLNEDGGNDDEEDDEDFAEEEDEDSEDDDQTVMADSSTKKSSGAPIRSSKVDEDSD